MIGCRSVSRLRSGGGEEHPESAGMMRWLLTYADMITLLLALFVILFSISTIDRVKLQRLAHEISGGFNADDALNNPPNGGSTGVQSGNVDKDTDLNRIDAQLQTYIWMNSLESEVTTRIDRRGLVISLLADRSLYASGSADLPSQTKRLLDEIDALFSTTRSHLRVEGNTDNVPIETPEYPTNWELSAARATGVTRYLVEQRHLSPLRVSLAGYGEYRPRADNAVPSQRRFNRRVDIVILNAATTKADEAVQP
ncbi:MAG: flagellar motor protein MotB [Candidatus Velthaea sp.]|jgi:chemotaxis protein MotB